MKLTISIKLDLKTKEVQAKVEKASKIGLRNGIVLMAADAVKDSPWLTGNNRRSIAYEVSGMGSSEFLAISGKGAIEEVDPNKTEGALYSTSGYGGYLETGTVRMAARPYIFPAFNRHKAEIPLLIKEALENER